MKSFILFFACLILSTSAQVQQTQIQGQNDVEVFQYAATLENLESTFYNYFLGTYNTDAMFQAAGYPTGTFALFQQIQSHENAHVTYLSQALGTSMPAACTNGYNFSTVTDINSFVSAASLLENTGTQAYDGALNQITLAAHQTQAAIIATIEGRHSAYLNYIIDYKANNFKNGNNGGNNNVMSPFGTAPASTVNGLSIPAGTFDNALAPSTVASAVTTNFFKNGMCSGTPALTLPQAASSVGRVSVTTPSGTESANATANDINTLNFALALECLESAFYTQGQAAFNSGNFTDAGFTALDYTYLGMIQQHEATHVVALQAAVNSIASGSAYVCCTGYTFGNAFTSVQNYLNTAWTLESTGVMAYDGAVNAITDFALQQTAATIATVEARHASYLATVLDITNKASGANVVPFPGAFDTPQNASTILTAVLATGFLNSATCVSNAYLVTHLPTISPSAPTIAFAGNGASSSSTGTNIHSSSSTGSSGGAISTITHTDIFKFCTVVAIFSLLF